MLVDILRSALKYRSVDDIAILYTKSNFRGYIQYCPYMWPLSPEVTKNKLHVTVFNIPNTRDQIFYSPGLPFNITV